MLSPAKFLIHTSATALMLCLVLTPATAHGHGGHSGAGHSTHSVSNGPGPTGRPGHDHSITAGTSTGATTGATSHARNTATTTQIGNQNQASTHQNISISGQARGRLMTGNISTITQIGNNNTANVTQNVSVTISRNTGSNTTGAGAVANRSKGETNNPLAALNCYSGDPTSAATGARIATNGLPFAPLAAERSACK